MSSGRLELRAFRDGERTVVRDRHEGPLRVLAALHPEGPEVNHQVLVHPPGGLVGGDRLELQVELAAGAHLLVTTPGATRLYRSRGDGIDGRDRASQHVVASLAPDARLEWLPLETLVYPGAQSASHLSFALAPGARMIGIDVLALGLPASEQPFVRGRHQQDLQITGVWRERGLIDAADQRLLRSPLGWAGRSVLATAWAAAGTAFSSADAHTLLDAGRAVVAVSSLRDQAGVTMPNPRVCVLRVLADRVEPAFDLLQRVWAAWRPAVMGRPACPPRVWRT